MSAKPIAVLGQGAWGTAIACVLADAGHEVLLWCHDVQDAKYIINEQINRRYMPAKRLSARITASTSLKEVLGASKYVFEAIPVKFLRSVVHQFKPFARPDHCWVVLSKGIENETLALPTQIIEQELDVATTVVLSGPSYADEVVRRQPTGVLIASEDTAVAQQVCQLVGTDYFVGHTNDDPIGVQLCGAVKNVIALAVGFVEGAGYGENMQALVFTAGWHDMLQFLERCGGHKETANTLAGIGDLVLTAAGSRSRNRAVGVALGRGERLEQVLKRTGYIPEGINTLRSLHALVTKKSIYSRMIVPLYECLLCSEGSIERFMNSVFS